MGEITSWVLCWRFDDKPASTFYNLLAALVDEKKVDALAPRTVRCRETEHAYLVRELVESFGGQVESFAANGQQLDDRRQRSGAAVQVRQLQAARLSRRGRHKAAP